MELIEFFPGRPTEVSSLVEETEKRGFKGFLGYLDSINPFYLLFLGSILVFNILLLISSMSLIFNKEIDISIRIFASILIFYICFMASPAGYSRFKVCVIPFMLINMPFVFAYFKTHFRRLLPFLTQS
jgi:fatty acid desaturase